MIKNYIGNRKTIYTLTSGTEIVLTEDELKELLEENNFSIELKQEVEELKEELVSERAKKTFAENRVEELKDEIHDLKKDIEDLGKVAKPFMTIEEFKTIKWTGQMEVEYQNRIYPVATVDLQDIKIGIEVLKNGKTKIKFIDCTSCRLIDKES
jgi:chromosome segregation ATPase